MYAFVRAAKAKRFGKRSSKTDLLGEHYSNKIKMEISMKNKMSVIINLMLPIFYTIMLCCVKYIGIETNIEVFIWDYRDLLWFSQFAILLIGVLLSTKRKYKIACLAIFISFFIFAMLTIRNFNYSPA